MIATILRECLSRLQNCRAIVLMTLVAGPLAATTSFAQLPEPMVGRSSALLPNGGFDVGDGAGHPIDWDVEGTAVGIKVVNRKADRTSGAASLEFGDPKGNGVTVRSRRIVAVPGGEYVLTAKVKAKQGKPATLGAEFWSFERKLLGEAQADSPTGVTDWQSLKVVSIAPAETAHVTVRLRTERDAAGISMWDEVDLRLTPPPYDPNIGTERELFLDDVRIESAVRVGRVVHPGKTTARPVVRADQPWEQSAYIYGSVYKVGDVFRMWYTAYNDVNPNYHTAYAESRDGVNWSKPNLGLAEFAGSKANNMVAGGGGTVAYNPDAPADRRYTSLGFESGKVNETLGYYVWFSADGLTWKRASDKPALFDGDVSNISYDPFGKQYIATIKKRMFTSRTPGIYHRTAFISTSLDAMTWTPPRIAVGADYADDGAAQALGGLEAQIYGMPVVRYESTYVGFPWVFRIVNYTQGVSAATGDGPVEVQIASSRDLRRWARPARDTLIPPGPVGSWNQGAHYTASNILVDEKAITMYYSAFNNGHGGANLDDPNRGKNIGQIGMATWRRDGWVSLSNGGLDGLGEVGTVTTKPLKFAGQDLHVNADVRSGGTMKVEVLDATDGKAIPGFQLEQAVAVSGDRLNATIEWNGGKQFDELAGRAIKLRFTLAGAELYSYWIAH